MKNMKHLKKVLRGTAMIALTLVLTTSCNNNHTSDVGGKHSENSLDKRDSDFLNDVAEINQKEILLGQLAQQKAISEDARELGRMMVESHKKCQDDLINLTNSKSIHLNEVSSEDAVDCKKDLSEKTGKDFDKKYCDKMVEGHEDAISKFEKAYKNSEDQDIRNFASNTLPELRKHLEHAKICNENCEKM